MFAYRLPLYGHIAVILLASATLLCLKGLKSSLTWTVAFLTTFVPKKGLGIGVDSAGLTRGDVEAEAEVVLGIGEVGPGVKAFAFGFGRKDDAFAFSRFVEVGEVGTVVVDELPLVCGLGDFVLFPLKGGMG
jgi:hypothetical protein